MKRGITVKGLVIPLNVGNHTFHIDGAVETEILW